MLQPPKQPTRRHRSGHPMKMVNYLRAGDRCFLCACGTPCKILRIRYRPWDRRIVEMECGHVHDFNIHDHVAYVHEETA